jgi:hypothetical protein
VLFKVAWKEGVRSDCDVRENSVGRECDQMDF